MADLDAIRAIVAGARAAGRSTLLEPEGLALLAAAGIEVPAWRAVDHEARVDDALVAAFPGDRVVVKVVAAEIRHKTEVGGVAIVPRDAGAVRDAMAAMRARLPGPPDGFTVSAFVPHDTGPGGELLLSLRWTDDMGAIVAVGAGGILTEALAADLRPGAELAVVSPALTPPADPDRLARALAGATAVRLATTPLRGQPPRLAPARLAATVAALAALAPLCPDELTELEINPAAVTRGGLVALDVLVTLGDGPRPVRAPRPLAKIARLLAPRSIAVVGVSARGGSGRVILANILREGFDPGAVTVIKPGTDTIDGVRCVPDLASMPGKVDLLVVVLPAAATPAFVAEVVERDLAESLIVIPGGLEEKAGGDVHARRMREALAAARAREDGSGGPVINGGNCLGIRSRPGRYDTLFIPRAKLPSGSRPAPVGLVTGSGAFAITRLSRMAPLDPRYVITIGNQMDLTAGDILAHLADDPAVRVFGVYVEGFMPGDGLRFMEAASRIRASGRRVILYRAGRTAAGASASASHTAAIAGDVTVTRELARAAGVTIADTPGAFDDLLRTFALLDGRPARGRRLGAMSNAGSECVTIADHAGPLELVGLSEDTVRRLGAILEPAGITSVVDIHNPLDLTPIANAAITADVVRVILGAAETDTGIVGIVPMTDTIETLPPGDGHGEDLARDGALADVLAAAWRETAKPWVCVVDAGPLYAPFTERLAEAGIPVLATADAATRALAAWCDEG
ncbi:MAG TPA: acetate--CoA ligase family protein [Candidatus Limnocylindrales bacterium]|nr:acetate--CoA ligase family protein [Candidatus Limnocylindrales bacterium]